MAEICLAVIPFADIAMIFLSISDISCFALLHNPRLKILAQPQSAFCHRSYAVFISYIDCLFVYTFLVLIYVYIYASW